MHRFEGGCHCGNVRVTGMLRNELSAYSPRTCDCDFCRKHGASYVSDPLGSLHIEVRSSRCLGRYRQGDEIADFLFCTGCGVCVGVLYQEDDYLYATVNSSVLAGNDGFGVKEPVTPRWLAASEKVRRWKSLWFSKVTLVVESA
jgi:hypothetical protein